VALWDPRLASPLLLVLAGQRLLHRQAQPQLPDWEKSDGLCALLDYARRCGVQPAPEVDEHSTGLGALLWQARQRQEGAGHGA
jgi:hypothetical protein